MWGHALGTTYLATNNGGIASGTHYFHYDAASQNWIWDRFLGDLHWWGFFDVDPYSYHLNAYVDIYFWGDIGDPYGNVLMGTLNDVSIQIDPAEPQTKRHKCL